MNAKLKSLSVITLATLSACSTVKEVTNVDLWPFGKGEQGREYLPANSIPYACDSNKKFYIRNLDKGAAVWLILPDREVALAQVGSSKIYSNGISKLDLTGDVAVLEVNETTKYVGCKSNSIASVSKPAVVAANEAKSEAKPVAKAEAKDTSEKGWFDWMKFWESDDKKSEKPALPAKSDEKSKVAAPAPVAAPAVAPVKEPMPEVAKVESVEPIKAAPAPEMVEEEVSAKPSEVAKVAEQEDKVASQDATQAAVAKAVDGWANAWRTKNVNTYLSFYSEKFKPEGMSKKAWIAQRKARVGANPAEITLTLDKVNVVADAKKATVTFAQHYASAKYSDNVAKVLKLENVKGQWLIVKETAKAVSAK